MKSKGINPLSITYLNDGLEFLLQSFFCADEFFLYFRDCFFFWFSQFMFPYSYNLPSLLFKFSADLFVSFFIFFYLFLPEVFVGSGLNKMSGASVPETSVHKHNSFISGKDNIWFAVKSAAKCITKTSFPQ